MSEYDELIAADPSLPADPVTEAEYPEELPPEPDEVTPLSEMPLAERERFKLAQMTPEQKARYDSATEEIMAHPAVKSFAQEEERRLASKADVQAAFLKAWKEKKK